MCGGVAAPAGRQRAPSWRSPSLAAISIDRLQLLLSSRRLPFFYQQVAGGLLATLLTVGGRRRPGSPIDTSLVVTANIVMLLAGIGFMGALQDALSGFYITANARLLEAVLATAGIIAGVTVGPQRGRPRSASTSARWSPAGPGGQGCARPRSAPRSAAGAFAFASYAPRRILLPIAVIAGVAMVIYLAFVLNDFDRPWAAGVAAFFIGLVTYGVAGRFGVPPLVVVVSAVVPMLPGLSIYRGLSLLAAGRLRHLARPAGDVHRGVGGDAPSPPA